LERALGDEFPGAEVVAHRIVHGGERFREEVALDRTVVPELRALTDLARLHRPKSLPALDAVSTLLLGLSAVACFAPL
jgi:acetate kinase